jgi:hypothetical protein
VSEVMSDKIAKLLAKAASTTYPAEAELFRSKAKELQKKYGVSKPRPIYTGPTHIYASGPIPDYDFKEAVTVDWSTMGKAYKG